MFWTGTVTICDAVGGITAHGPGQTASWHLGVHIRNQFLVTWLKSLPLRRCWRMF